MAAHAIHLDVVDENLAPEVLDNEDRILRRWTPVLLRAVLAVAVLFMTAGVVLALLLPHPPVSDVAELATSSTADPSFTNVFTTALKGEPGALATLGLMALTLVPLVRVAFCLLLFLKQRSMIFVAFTAYVLAALTMGVLLGKIG